MAAVQRERAATPITCIWGLVLEAVRLECQMLWRSSAALCEMCLGQEGCLCQVPVALLWGSVCCCSAGSCEQSCCTNSFLLAAASAQPGRAEFQFLVCIFVRQCHTQLCVLVPIKQGSERRDPLEKVFAFCTNPNLTVSFSGGQCVWELFAGFAVMLGMAHFLKLSVQKSKVSRNLIQ